MTEPKDRPVESKTGSVSPRTDDEHSHDSQRSTQYVDRTIDHDTARQIVSDETLCKQIGYDPFNMEYAVCKLSYVLSPDEIKGVPLNFLDCVNFDFTDCIVWDFSGYTGAERHVIEVLLDVIYNYNKITELKTTKPAGYQEEIKKLSALILWSIKYATGFDMHIYIITNRMAIGYFEGKVFAAFDRNRPERVDAIDNNHSTDDDKQSAIDNRSNIEILREAQRLTLECLAIRNPDWCVRNPQHIAQIPICWELSCDSNLQDNQSNQSNQSAASANPCDVNQSNPTEETD